MKVLKENRCQCCNTSLGIDAHNVFGEDGRKQNIASLLFDNIGKKLNENNGIQYAICDSCWQQLIQCHEFKQKCIRANEMAAEEENSVNNDDKTIRNDIESTEMYSPLKFYEELKSDKNQYAKMKPYEEILYELESNDMEVEYLDDNYDMYEEDIEYASSNTNTCIVESNSDKSSGTIILPFDFTSILVKPFFVLRFGNSQTYIFTLNSYK